MRKLLIVDGLNLYFQMFFGMPPRITNASGKAIQGSLGFVGALIRIIKMTNPTHIVVLFDGQHANYRTELLPEYKPIGQITHKYRLMRILFHRSMMCTLPYLLCV